MSNRITRVAVWVVTAIAILPVIFHWQARTSAGVGRHIVIGLAYLVAVLICCAAFHAEKARIGGKQALALVFLIFLLTGIVNFMHKVTVDNASGFFPAMSNLQWQMWVQDETIDLSSAVLPHSYRFLPNAIVRWMQLAGVTYTAARNVYRLIFGLLLFYALYRFALLYTSYIGAICAMLFATAIYPVGFQHYAGQLADPLSHLSFVLCFIFLEIEDFPSFLTAMLIGSLAKETVLAMAGYYVMFRWRDKGYVAKSIIACIAAAIAFMGVRLFVLKGSLEYRQVSGVGASHILQNWHSAWGLPFLLTAGTCLPFLLLDWKRTAPSLQGLTFFLLPVLFLSNLFFGWLQETRNLMPLVFVLAVVAGRFLSNGLASGQKTTIGSTG